MELCMKKNSKKPIIQTIRAYPKKMSRAKPRSTFLEKLYELDLIGSLDNKGITSTNYKEFL